MKKQEKIPKILERLGALYGEPECALDYGNTFELLIAVILSAQCTDKRVNIVTKELFRVAPTPAAMLALGYERLVDYIYSCGFYRNKARNILSCCADLLTRYGGEVPSERAELKTLAGVGDKTANVVYAVGFGGQAIPVDTHVGRLARRLGLSQAQNPSIVMRELEAITPHEKKTLLHHLLITHGRQVCSSQKPKCDKCPLQEICVYFVEE